MATGKPNRRDDFRSVLLQTTVVMVIVFMLLKLLHVAVGIQGLLLSIVISVALTYGMRALSSGSSRRRD